MARRARKKGNGRDRSTAALDGAYVVTGACGRLGKLLTRRLHRVAEVIAIDRRPFPDKPKDVVHVPYPLRRKKVRDVFRRNRIAAVIHLGIMHDPRKKAEAHHAWNVEGFASLLEYCSTYRVPKVVLMSSASLYGGRPTNPQFIAEEAPLMAGARSLRVAGQVEVDMLAQSFFWRHPECETVILRPCSIVGRVANAPSNYLRLKVCPTVMGFDPMVQLIHEDDVVDAIMAALEPGIRGVFNVAGPTAAPLSSILRRLGRKTVPVPHLVARPVVQRLFDMKMTSFPPEEVDFVQFQCLVDDARARESLRFAPRHSLAELLADLDEPDLL